ncbi:hypothetical protein C8J57DRAFT_1718181 [Mycena rebaudengoi]|nr:hypothetical protein C8J57DRAFT_1718181 [Mycena rebaudengoi]
MRAKFALASAARKRRRRLFFALALVTNTHRTCAHPEHRPCAARQCRRVGAGIGTPMHSRHGRGLGNVYVPAFADASIAPRVFRCSTCGPHFCFTLAAEGFVMHVVRGRRLDCVEGSGGRVSEQCARSVAWAGDLAVAPTAMWLTGRTEGGKSWQVAMEYHGGDLWVVAVGSAWA